jgi:hypothetical protein
MNINFLYMRDYILYRGVLMTREAYKEMIAEQQ